jgi:hypothetical protein
MYRWCGTIVGQSQPEESEFCGARHGRPRGDVHGAPQVLVHFHFFNIVISSVFVKDRSEIQREVAFLL